MPVENGVAVVATNTWTAMQALDAITFDWAPAPYPATSAEMQAALAAAFTPDMQDSRQRDDGDVEAALTGDVFEAEYTVPYLAHATMEPMRRRRPAEGRPAHRLGRQPAAHHDRDRGQRA